MLKSKTGRSLTQRRTAIGITSRMVLKVARKKYRERRPLPAEVIF
jgi:hypothetical protein